MSNQAYLTVAFFRNWRFHDSPIMPLWKAVIPGTFPNSTVAGTSAKVQSGWMPVRRNNPSGRIPGTCFIRSR